MTKLLLSPGDPPPVESHRPDGRSPFFLVCDHAGNAIPGKLGDLGLSPPELGRHIAFDIGAAGLARLMSDTLDATLVMSGYSRLVIDCNRPPGAPDSIAPVSDGTIVPGNQSLSEDDRRARTAEIFAPYHARIEQELDRRAGRETLLVAVHSYTPVFGGAARAIQAAVLYGRDDRLARVMLELLRREQCFVVGDNDPYDVTDDTDYTIPVHGERRGLHHVLIEVRQDLIADEAGQREWSERLCRLLDEALTRL